MSGWLNISCSGKFHYLYYARYLSAEVLKKIYFSHRLSTTGSLKPGLYSNYYIKEYLTGLHIKLFREVGLTQGMAWYNKIWARQLERNFEVAPINLFLMHGNCISTMEKVKREGRLVVGEAVNSHPDALRKILLDEALRINYPNAPGMGGAAGIKTELELIDYLLCPSRVVAESYIAQGFNPAKVLVLPYGVETTSGAYAHSLQKKAFERRVGLPTSIVSVGQVSLRKGQHRLLELIRRKWREAEIPLPSVTFIGRADPDYLKVLRSYGVPFTLVGHMRHEKLMQCLGDFDLFCLSSIEDGFAMVAMEAVAVGTPVMVSCYAGASELLESVPGCAVFDPFSQQSFDASLELVGLEPVEFELSRFGWQNYAIALTNTLRSLL